MLSQPKHGRRRAVPAPTSGKGRRRAAVGSRPSLGLRGQQLSAAAAAAGLIALTALSAAQADGGKVEAANEPSASAAGSPQPGVTADPGAGIAFSRPEVSSLPAPKQTPAPKAQSAQPLPAKTQAVKAQPSQVSPARNKPVPESGTTVGSAALVAPLASVNVSSPFGYRVNPLTGAAGEMHTGIDLTGSCSTPVFAAGAGTVIEAGWSQNGGGNRIVVDHGNGLKTTYNHLETIGVSVGQVLTTGTRIAGVGTTGNSTGCHLHFEVMVNDQTVNPATFI